MHLKRWLTALILGPVLMGVILSNHSALFYCAVIVVGVIGHQEYLGLVFPGNAGLMVRVLGGLLGVVIMSLPMLHATIYAWVVFTGLAMVTFSFFLFRETDVVEALNQAAKFLLGLFYVPLLVSFYVFIWREEYAAQWIIFSLGVVFLGDTGAFYSGRLWGRHKLYPRVSPGKTVEGAIGGLLLSMVFALAFARLVMPFWDWRACAVLTLILNSLGQLGDLFESLVKRSMGVKDSGSFLPGHGGMMDRIDGVLFSVPALYVYLKYIY